MVQYGRPLRVAQCIALFLFICLSACGGGGAATEVASDPSQPATEGERPDGSPVATQLCDCAPLDSVVGASVVVADIDQLFDAVQAANAAGGNRTILVADGVYYLNSLLGISADHVMIRSLSGDREAVVLQGDGMDGNVPHVFLVTGSHVTIADLSLGAVYYHGIQVQGENGADNLTVHNVRIFDTGEQMLKGSYGGTNGSDNGLVECSLFEYTDAFGPQWYIGGIDVHKGVGWVVRGNTFKNIRSPSGSTAEYAVHFWSDAEDPLVEGNLILNCDRGIGLGMGTRGCTGGLVRNNMIYADDQGIFSDVGIMLESATGVRVLNNTIYFDHDYANAIEYRWAASTDNVIINNLANRRIQSRDGGQAVVSSNVIDATADWFRDLSTGDLHLAGDVNAVVDAGAPLPDLPTDLDGDLRPSGNGPDIGADEFIE